MKYKSTYQFSSGLYSEHSGAKTFRNERQFFYVNFVSRKGNYYTENSIRVTSKRKAEAIAHSRAKHSSADHIGIYDSYCGHYKKVSCRKNRSSDE